MAFNFSKLNFFKGLDARSRVIVLLGGVVVFIFIIYFTVSFFSSDAGTVGPSQVSNAPQDLRSVPGGQTSAEYQRALLEANRKSVEQAKMSGSSAVPTMVNFGNQSQTGGCIICSDESANVKSMLDDWVRQGKLTPEISSELHKLADKGVSVDEYAALLNDLVKQGKISPEQARALLNEYKKQHNNQILAVSEAAMDEMIKNGQVPLESANALLAFQKKNVSTTEYARELQKLVSQGKFTLGVSQKLLSQYTMQVQREVIQKSIASLRQLAREGKIIPEVENTLVDLEMKTVPISEYSDTLKKFMDAGKLIPAIANSILDEYRSQKAAIGPTSTIDDLVKLAEKEAFDEINDLMAAGKMSPEVGAALTDMINKNIPFEDYVKIVNQMVQGGKLTLEISKLKIADYKKVKALRDMALRLRELQANNASTSDYTLALKDAVRMGAITPDDAARLLQEYTATLGVPYEGGGGQATTSAFAALQKRVDEVGVEEPVSTAGEFETTATEQQQQLNQQVTVDQQAQIQAMMGVMQNQAGQLIGSWQPPTMESRQGRDETEKEEGAKGQGNGQTASASPQGVTGTAVAAALPPIVKAGEILFAVLDTEVNSDYPDSPVMATIVNGKYKGAKMLGKLMVTKGVSGQLDRISLNFTLMNMDVWPKGKAVTAYAIDPDTARTVLASHVNYHYLQRFGAIMATSFVQGYAQAISSSSSTSTTGIFGTTTTNPELNPSQKLATAIGQVGQTLGSAMQNYLNIPPTVKVDSGVGLGILFMSDVT